MVDSRKETLAKLEQAFARLQTGKLRSGKRVGRVSISAVAEEAEVTPALIHNRYPELAEKIRAHAGRDTRRQRDDKQAELQAARLAALDLRRRLVELESDLVRLASINAALRIDNDELRAMLESRNVVALPSRFDPRGKSSA